MAAAAITALVWTLQTALLSNYVNTHFLRQFHSAIGHNLTRFAGCVLLCFIFIHIVPAKKRTSLRDLAGKAKILVLPAVCMVCMNLSNSYALQECGVTLTYVIKSTIPVWTVLYSLSQGERYSIYVAPALLLSCMGVAMASMADFDFNLPGFLFALLSTLAQTAFNISSKARMQKANVSSSEGFFVSCCICYSLLQTIFYVEAFFNPASHLVFMPAYTQYTNGMTWPIVLLVLTAVSYFVEYQLNFAFVTMVSSLTFAITDIVRRLATIACNAFLFDKKLSPLNIAGILTALGGALLYAIIVNRNTTAKKRSSKRSSSLKRKSRNASPAPTKEGREKPTFKTRKSGRGQDILDKLIGTIGELGVIALIIAGASIYIGTYGVPEETGMFVCSLVMGLGKGGVPGMSTLASAFFALMAPEGRVNQMMALVVPVTMMCDVTVGLTYMHDALWAVAMKLAVWTGIGIFAGIQINNYMSDDLTRKLIGVLFLLVVATMIYDKFKKNSSASNEELARKKAFLFSVKVLAPCGVIGGIASYITNNMGPMLNVYLLSLNLDKYALVGTRSAIFISINAVKLGTRISNGDLPCDMLPLAASFGAVGIVGVILAKIWLKHASPAVFRFVYERVTLTVVSITGSLLICGWDLKSLVRVGWEAAAPYVNNLVASNANAPNTTVAL